MGGSPSALAFGARSLWVADGDGRDVAQIDPGSNKVRMRIPVGNAPRSIAVAAGALWVVSGVDGSVQRIGLGRARVMRSIRLGAIPTAIVAGAGALWVASEESGTVSRVDPRTGDIVRAIGVGNGPGALAVGEGKIWVVNRDDGTVSRIDPATNKVSGLVPVGRDPTAVAAGHGTLWVARGQDGTVVRVDPDTARVVGKRSTGSSPIALALAGGALWTATAAPAAAHRGGTLRVLGAVGKRFPIDWLDVLGYMPPTWQATSLAYDGLVAYRRVGGAAGATLVGALAESVPTPTDDGLTYVFTLRSGVRYSDGRLVQPEDFRASIERFLRVGTGNFPPFYEGIVGARRCMRERARCDLSSGIETDRRTRTITVHLTRPDGEFLHKLTVPMGYVVPADTPVRLLGNRPPPGTGPYRVASWDVKRGGTLVRNPHFRSWSDARPAGYADRIEFLPARGIESQLATVRGGRADVAVVAGSFGSDLSRRRIAALAASAPGQVHSGPQPTTGWMFLNVREAPFDHLSVRRALNFATDRARIVELVGGPEVAHTTCQILPTAFPGHQPYCPYTARPTAGGGWTAPDMDKARRLVKASGTAGERVVVRVPEFRRSVGRYFTRLLDDLGFHASLRAQPYLSYFPSIADPRSRAQIGFVGWAADIIAPSGFIVGNFTCRPAEGLNVSRLCDRRMTRLVHRALAAPAAEAAPAWAATDRRVTDLAAAVPLTNERAVVFVSKRVGNVQHHSQWLTLLDQMWVR